MYPDGFDTDVETALGGLASKEQGQSFRVSNRTHDYVKQNAWATSIPTFTALSTRANMARNFILDTVESMLDS